MVEPSKELQLVFDKAIKDATKLQHEYVTLEHLLFAMMCSDNFFTLIKGFGADVDYIKSNLEYFLKNPRMSYQKIISIHSQLYLQLKMSFLDHSIAL